MRRSGNREENKRIIMDLETVLKSHSCPYIVHCYGIFITEVCALSYAYRLIAMQYVVNNDYLARHCNNILWCSCSKKFKNVPLDEIPMSEGSNFNLLLFAEQCIFVVL